MNKLVAFMLWWIGRHPRSPSKVAHAYERQWKNYRMPTEDIEWVCGEKQWRGSVHTAKDAHRRFLERWLTDLPSGTVLEIGCGNGLVMLPLAQACPQHRFMGIDVTESGPAEIRKRGGNAEQGDARQLPYADRSIDYLYTVLALEQMEVIRDPVLHELRRVLKSEACLIEPWAEWNYHATHQEYVKRMGYWQGKLFDLPNYGFRLLFHNLANFPQKTTMQVGAVIVR